MRRVTTVAAVLVVPGAIDLGVDWRRVSRLLGRLATTWVSWSKTLNQETVCS